MNKFKDHFNYNKRQRNGILFLLLFIFILQGVYFFVDFNSTSKNNDSKEIAMFTKEMDSLELVQKEGSKVKLYPFNPNYLSDFKASKLGMTVAEIDRLLKYRAEGKYVNSSKQFQEITKINDSLLTAISSLFKFPNNKYSNSKYAENKVVESIRIKDINSASKEDLIKINGVGEKLATRIIGYRDKLGGFSINDQLYEVYYLDKEVANKIIVNFKVMEPPKIIKLNINSATFKEVLAIVYIDYELTKKIFQYKSSVGKIESIDELKKIDNFPLEKFNRIALYLQAN